MICFASMMGALMIMQIHGTVESILFARAASIAPAENGDAKNMLGLGAAGVPGLSDEGLEESAKSVGLRYGEEKDSRYSAMKKVSLRAQKVKRTHYVKLACEFNAID